MNHKKAPSPLGFGEGAIFFYGYRGLIRSAEPEWPAA